MRQTDRRFLILAVDDSSLESIRVPFLRMGIIQHELCEFRTADTLLAGKALIDELSQASDGPPLGLAFIDMSFESDKIYPPGKDSAEFRQDVAVLQDVLGYTDGMPLRNGGIWLLQRLLSSRLQDALVPVVYSARTDITDTLSPLTEKIGFRVLTQLPAEFQIACMLDYLVIAACRRGVGLNYGEIKETVRRCLEQDRPALAALQDLGELQAQGLPWRLRHLCPQVFGRGLKMATQAALSAGGIREPLAHLCRLAASGHQGILLRQLLDPAREAYPLPAHSLRPLFEDPGSIDDGAVLQAGMVVDTLSGLLNSETTRRLRATLQRYKRMLERPAGARQTAEPPPQWFKLAGLSQDLVRQAQETSPQRCCFLAGGRGSGEAEWHAHVAGALQDAMADRILVTDVLRELLASLAPVVAGAPLEVAFARQDREASFRLAWTLPRRRLLSHHDVPLPFRSPAQLLGLRTHVLSEDASHCTCFAPYADCTPAIVKPQPGPVSGTRIVLNLAFDI